MPLLNIIEDEFWLHQEIPNNALPPVIAEAPA
jgi:hypothetical protein